MPRLTCLTSALTQPGLQEAAAADGSSPIDRELSALPQNRVT
jgi:hypothetical protein